jgi:hypothetical protein
VERQFIRFSIFFVTLTKVRVQLRTVKLDSGFRRNDDGETRHARARPAHLPLHEMAGSSPRLSGLKIQESLQVLTTVQVHRVR